MEGFMNTSAVDAQAVWATVVAIVSTWGLRVVGAVVLLVVGILVAKAIRGSVRKALQRGSMDATLVPFLSGIVYYLVLAFVVIAVLGLFGIQTTSIIAVLGAAGLAVGLALQGTLANFAAGVMLLVFRPFRVGDYVDAGGIAGSVESIGVFATTLNTPDNVRIVVPNSAVSSSTIKNYAANETRRLDMVLGISYSDDIGKAIATIQGILAADARVLKEPAPVIAVAELGDSSVNLVVRPWCRRDDYWNLKFDTTRAMKERLEAAGCSIPFPQRVVHVFQKTA
jgi:small conductance mechanosensitive channel